MIKINRSNPSNGYLRAIKNYNNWDDFVKNESCVYTQYRKSLENDQNGLSGYTELPLSHRNRSTHIDHFLKKGIFHNDVFNPNNHIVDDHTKDYGSDFKDRTVKQNNNKDLINPINENPHDFFTYQVSGKIVLKTGLDKNNSNRADFTINSFNLNHLFLVKKRSELMILIDTYLSGGLDSESIKSALKNLGLPSVVDFVLNNY